VNPRAVLVAFAMLAAAAQHAAAQALEDVLPKTSGKSVCFSLTVPAVMTVEDWSEAAVTFVPVPGLFENGKQATRPQPKLHPKARITRAALSITSDDTSPEEPYRFRLTARIAGWKRVLRGSGSCAFFKRDKPPGGATADQLRGFSCYIECDGGSVGIARSSEPAGLAVRFDKSGLRMTAGCSEETSSVRLTAAQGEQVLRLKPARARDCRPVRGR
jgi:hypothetical protein